MYVYVDYSVLLTLKGLILNMKGLCNGFSGRKAGLKWFCMKWKSLSWMAGLGAKPGGHWSQWLIIVWLFRGLMPDKTS